MEKSQVTKGAEDELKGLSPEAKAKVEAIFKSNAELVAKADTLAKELAVEREARMEKEFVAKAAAFKNLGDQKELVSILKSAYAVSKENGEKLETILKANDEAISKGNLFKEIGSGSPMKGATTYEQVEKAAEQYVAKSGKEVSKAEAVTAFLNTAEGQKMYGEYKNQRGGI